MKVDRAVWGSDTLVESVRYKCRHSRCVRGNRYQFGRIQTIYLGSYPKSKTKSARVLLIDLSSAL